MAMRAEDIKSLIQTALPDSEVSIEDLRGDGEHYSCHIRSRAFVGKTRVAQHKMVYDALGGRMGDQLHALAIQTTAIED